MLGPEARPRRPTRDAGNLHVLEAVLLALILLGAAYWTTTLGSSLSDTARPHAHLGRLSHDTLVVLDGLEEERGSLLDLFLTEAFHCAVDEVRSADSCDGTRGANLSFRIENYLPPGAGYMYGLDNGLGVKEFHRSVIPGGEVASATHPFVPDWNLTFVRTELSCYEAAMPVNATMLPIYHARHVDVSNITVRASNNATANATEAFALHFWNVTMPAATRPLSGTLGAEVNATSGTYLGVVSYDQCALGGLGTTLVEAVRNFTLVASDDTPALGQTVTFSADLEALSALASVVLRSANVTVYEPIPGRGTEPDTYAVAARSAFSSGLTPTASWSVPEDALFGLHPVVLEVDLDVGGTHVRASSVATLEVALPSGLVPFDPPYRAVLQAWFPDWH